MSFREKYFRLTNSSYVTMSEKETIKKPIALEGTDSLIT